MASDLPAVDLCHIPAGPVPHGHHSNFEHPSSLTPVKMAVVSLLIFWAVIFTSGRIYVNIRKLSLADYFALIALVLAISVFALLATSTKLDRHIWDTPACYFDGTFAMYIFFPALCFNIGGFFAKASILLLFDQIFTVHKGMRYAIWFGQAFNFVLYATAVAIAIVYETPRAGESWSAILDGRTLIPLPWWQAQSALITAFDIYIFVLPLPHVWNLTVSIRRRIPVYAVFSLALLGIVASIASLVQRFKVGTSDDQTWISAILSLCSAVELCVAIIVSSGPGFSNFLRCHFPGLYSSASKLFGNLDRPRDVESGPPTRALTPPRQDEFHYAIAVKPNNNTQTEDEALDDTLRYYGVRDSSMLKSELTTRSSTLSKEFVIVSEKELETITATPDTR